MKTLILHHSADLDGVLSGVIANYYLNERKNINDVIIHHGADYGDKLDIKYTGEHQDFSLEDFDNIYVIDFSDDWLFNSEHRNKIIWIDHHAPAIEKNPEVQKYVMDGVAACRLTQQYFCNLNYHFIQLHDYIERNYGGQIFFQEPLIVALAGEHDIWDKSSTYASPFNFGVSNNLSFKRIDYLYREHKKVIAQRKNDKKQIEENEFFKFTVDVGNEIINYIQYTSHILGGGVPVSLFGMNGKSFNTHIKSSYIHRQKPDEDFIMVWSYKGGNKIKISFYSETHDVVHLAQHFGGGGHKRACGCAVDIHVLTSILSGRF